MRGGLVLFGLFIALLLGEVLVRIFGHEGPVYTFRDPVIGRRYTRSWEGDVWNEEAGRVVHVRFNREGMRDKDWPEERAENTVRIAILGDSMVAAMGVDEEKTFPKLLEAHLQALEEAQAKESGRAARRIEVMNWGVQGSSPALESVLYELRVRRYRPQLVVTVYFTGNDFSDDWQPIGGRRQGWGEVGRDGTLAHVPFGGSEFSFNEWLARNSRFYAWQKRALAGLNGGEPDEPRSGLRIFDASGDPELGKAWEFAYEIQQRLFNLTRDDGVRYGHLPILLPCADEVHDDLWQAAAAKAAARGWKLDRDGAEHRLVSDPVEWTLGNSRNTTCGPVICLRSLRPAMLQAVGGRPSTDPEAQLFLRGTGHLNERGHGVVAEALALWVYGATESPR